jgi:hypothetical protein
MEHTFGYESIVFSHMHSNTPSTFTYVHTKNVHSISMGSFERLLYTVGLDFFIFNLSWFSKNKWSKQNFRQMYIWRRDPRRRAPAVVPQGVKSLPPCFPASGRAIAAPGPTSTLLNINDQTVWSRYMQIWSRNTFLWLTYDQIELVREVLSHLVYHDQLVILVIEVELFHDQHVFRHRNVFLLWPSQMVTKLVTEGDATWHGPCWLLTWQGACWHGYDDVALWHNATCRAVVCPRVELWMVHVSHSGLSTCRAAVCPRFDMARCLMTWLPTCTMTWLPT